MSEKHHIIPVRVYLIVFSILLLLTVATVAVAYVEKGFWGPIVALAIASAKAALVIMYFMHVRYSPALVILFSVGGFYWLIILLVFVMADWLTR